MSYTATSLPFQYFNTINLSSQASQGWQYLDPPLSSLVLSQLRAVISLSVIVFRIVLQLKLPKRMKCWLTSNQRIFKVKSVLFTDKTSQVKMLSISDFAFLCLKITE